MGCLKFGFSIFLIFQASYLLGQEPNVPYYQEPSQRRNESDQNNFPNLINFDIQYYFTIEASVKLDLIEKNTGILTHNTHQGSINYPIEINLGMNRNNNYFFEIGYQKNTFEMYSVFIDRLGRSFTFENVSKTQSIPLRFKKRIYEIDKIAKSAQLNAIIGAYFPIAGQIKNQGKGKLNLTSNSNLSAFNFEFSGESTPIFIELGLELKGKVFERFDIGVFAKSRWTPNPKINNKFNIVSKSGESETLENYIKGVDFVLGLQFRLNSKKYKKYVSKIN